MSKNIYLTAKYAAKPRFPHLSSQTGYMKDDANVKYDEVIDVTRGLKHKVLSEARVILDITAQKVIKNTFSDDKSFMQMFQYFYESSPQEISQSLRQVGIIIETPEPLIDIAAEVIAAPIVIEAEVIPVIV